jgi:hypothetical protein
MSWLYVQGLVDSNLASKSQIQQPNVFVMLKGKPMQQRFLLHAWGSKPWMRVVLRP